ncbi:MAG: hypothetical protein ABJZ55_22660 [Fuerstiella sp.]
MKMVIVAIVGLVIFGASAAGSWYVKTQILYPPIEDNETDITDIMADPADTPPAEEGEASRLMPVAVRDDPMSVEELVRFSLRLKEQNKKLIAKEDEFQKRQVQQQLVLTDVKTEQDAITGLQTKLDKDLTVAESLITELNTLRADLKAQEDKVVMAQKELEDKRVEVNGGFESEDKRISSLMQGMSPEKAAASLQEFVDNGELDFAAQLLRHFDDRQAAKILDSIDNMKLVNELIRRTRVLKNTTAEDK